MESRGVGLEDILRVFTACQYDARTLLLDLRDFKTYKKLHVMQSFNVRLAANGKALLDYSKNTYSYRWSPDCWWDKHVVVYGEAPLKKDHPVINFLIKDAHAKSIAYLKTTGFGGIEEALPFICTPSTKANATKKYPGIIEYKRLYLGSWDDAASTERLNELGIKRVLSIHNSPEDLKLPSKMQHLQMKLADVDTQDISPFFDPSYDFIEAGIHANEAVLVHCGQGVSRSAALVIAYLMRKHSWTAAKARQFCQERRSLVQPNDGFWRSLCALEAQLGLSHRSDPARTSGNKGADAPSTLAEGAAGKKVVAEFISKTAIAASNHPAPATIPAAHQSNPLSSSPQNGQPDGAAPHGSSSREDRQERKREQRAASSERQRKHGRSHDDDHDCQHGQDQEMRPERSRHERHKRSRHDHDDRNHRHQEDRKHQRDRHDKDEAGGRHERDKRQRQDKSRDDGDEADRGHRERPDAHRDDAQGGPGRDQGQHESGNAHEDDASPGGLPLVDYDPAQQDSEGPEQDTTAAAPAAPPGRALVLDVLKHGRSAGHLRLSLSLPNQRCIFGRIPTCDVVLEHGSISRQHAQLATDAACHVFLSDLGSAHGTNLDGMWLKAKAPKLLAKGSKFKLGASTREYQVLELPQ